MVRGRVGLQRFLFLNDPTPAWRPHLGKKCLSPGVNHESRSAATVACASVADATSACAAKPVRSCKPADRSPRTVRVCQQLLPELGSRSRPSGHCDEGLGLRIALTSLCQPFAICCPFQACASAIPAAASRRRVGGSAAGSGASALLSCSRYWSPSASVMSRDYPRLLSATAKIRPDTRRDPPTFRSVMR
jgi:hypothetical protein